MIAVVLVLFGVVYAVVDECEPVSGGAAFQGIFRYINEELKSRDWRAYISHCLNADPKCKAPACARHCEYAPIGYRRRARPAGAIGPPPPPAPPLKYTCFDRATTPPTLLTGGKLIDVFPSHAVSAEISSTPGIPVPSPPAHIY